MRETKLVAELPERCERLLRDGPHLRRIGVRVSHPSSGVEERRVRGLAPLREPAGAFAVRREGRDGFLSSPGVAQEEGELHLSRLAPPFRHTELERGRDPRYRLVEGQRRDRRLGGAQVVVDRAFRPKHGHGLGEVVRQVGNNGRHIRSVNGFE